MIRVQGMKIQGYIRVYIRLASHMNKGLYRDIDL